jgi:cobalt-zinc-cadmium efflux system outer membrane protein
MKINILIALVALACTSVRAQQDSIVLPEPATLDIQFLLAEALMNNLDIQTMEYKSDVIQSRSSRAGSLEPPEIRYMREGMPGFRYSDAMYSRIELTQTIPFPSKLTTRRRLAEIQTEHAGHDRLEKVNEVVSKLKSYYYELWFIQQNIILNQEDARLMRQFATIAETRYGAGIGTQQDVLKSHVELALIRNEQITMRQRELSTKAMMMSILNRSSGDTLGYAVIPEDVVFGANLDSLIALAMQTRPMVVHDSLMIQEDEMMESLAKKEYIPDFRVGLERMTAPAGNFQGWSVSVGITLPFAPWTLGRTQSGVEEAAAKIKEAHSSYHSTRAMVMGNVRDLYYKATAIKQRLDTYRFSILPETGQSLAGSLTEYQTGVTNFFELIDAYRSKVNATREYYMTRMEFEQTVAMLEQEVGAQNISILK